MACNEKRVHEIITQSLKQGTMPIYNFEEEEVVYIEQELHKFLQECDSYIGANTAIRILLKNESVKYLCRILDNPETTLPRLSEQDRNRVGQTIMEGFSSKAWKNKILGDDPDNKDSELIGLSIYKSMKGFVTKNDVAKYNTNIRFLLDSYTNNILSKVSNTGKKLAIKYIVERINTYLENGQNGIQEYFTMLYRISPVAFVSEINKIYFKIKTGDKKYSSEVTAQVFDSISKILYFSIENDELLSGLKKNFITVWESFFDYCDSYQEIKQHSRTISDKMLLYSIKNAS